MKAPKSQRPDIELLSGIEPAAELEERFKKQLEHILRRRLTKAEITRDIICAAVFLGMSGVFGYFAAYVGLLGGQLPSLARWFMIVSFSAGCLGFLAGAIFSILELRGLRIASRQLQQATVGVPASFVLLYTTAWLVLSPNLQLELTKLVHSVFALLFFWIMVVGFVLDAKNKWRHEDALLEQKRTQLEIALLREKTTGGTT